MLKMARIVTGSVAERVAPTERASTKVRLTSHGILVHNHRAVPRDTADMKVPANANVSIEPILRKKLDFGVVSVLLLRFFQRLVPDVTHIPKPI